MDFVVYDLVKRETAVVEVSSAYEPSPLVKKARTFLECREKICEALRVRQVPFPEPRRFIGFVWDTADAYRKCKIADSDDDTRCFVDLAQIINLGQHWDGRGRGLPVRHGLTWRFPDA